MSYTLHYQLRGIKNGSVVTLERSDYTGSHTTNNHYVFDVYTKGENVEVTSDGLTYVKRIRPDMIEQDYQRYKLNPKSEMWMKELSSIRNMIHQYATKFSNLELLILISF